MWQSGIWNWLRKERGVLRLPKRPVQWRYLLQPNHWSHLCSDWRFYLEILVNHIMYQERIKTEFKFAKMTDNFMNILSDQVGLGVIQMSLASLNLQLLTRWARRSWSPRTFWPRRSPGRSANRSTERTPINSTSTATTCNPWWPWCFLVFSFSSPPYNWSPDDAGPISRPRRLMAHP